MPSNQKATSQPPQNSDIEYVIDSDYQLLRIYAYYRTLLSCIVLLLFTAKLAVNYLGSELPTLFFYTAWAYAISNVITLFLLWRKQFFPDKRQIVLLLFIDISAITLLMHASAGMDIGYLILVCIAAGTIFLPRHINLALAGFATILVLTEGVFSELLGVDGNRSVFAAGVFGILIFATALAFSILSERIRKSNEEAQEQAKHAAYLQKLSQLILERMRTGILVVNSQGEIVLANRAAKTFLSLIHRTPTHLKDITSIYEQLQLWNAYPHTRSPHFKTHNDGPELKISFAKMDAYDQSDTLIFIEDNRKLSQEAQQLKLASLGRLTASIAHEVRNPLGAISHAAQLLSESPNLSKPDARLSEIIQNHSKRVNHIIENVLQLSSRKNSMAELIDLSSWLPEFVREYKETKHANIHLNVHNKSIQSRIDTSQLHQVLTNLCDNGLRYSKENTGKEIVTVEAAIDLESELPYIEVIDDGIGVAEGDIEQIFEPFFTTESAGSGLGLYISRELCEGNQASLDYKRTVDGKSAFRITLAHPERIF
ncbi:MAG: sensor histidine kinase [Cellvibrionaceae bacterium]